MRISFYGKLADLIARDLAIDEAADAQSVGALRRLLADRYPDARDALFAPSLRICVGDDLVGDDHPVRAGDSVDFLPVLSGG